MSPPWSEVVGRQVCGEWQERRPCAGVLERPGGLGSVQHVLDAGPGVLDTFSEQFSARPVLSTSARPVLSIVLSPDSLLPQSLRFAVRPSLSYTRLWLAASQKYVVSGKQIKRTVSRIQIYVRRSYHLHQILEYFPLWYNLFTISTTTSFDAFLKKDLRPHAANLPLLWLLLLLLPDMFQ